ncbi:MAG TPA: sulfatase-like hydrolase/transferase [Thermomicrobiales bacterium]|nr:sulfatase-like hydrolase/transferase [Thermomicrobiales bacterium]
MKSLMLAVAVGLFVWVSHPVAQTTARPNIVLVIADDLGYGDLSSYGAPDLKTPHVDRLAREGVRMTDFYANAPVCTPTRAGLITGRYQQRYLLERPLSSNEDLGLPVTGYSLPQLLKNSGYATALIGKWHLGRVPQFSPNRHGFDYFWGYLTGFIDWYRHTSGTGQPDLWENGTAVTHTGYFGHEVTRRSVKFIEDNAQRPFFLEVAYGAPHWPYQSPHRPSTARDNAVHVFASADDHPTRADYVEIVEDADAGVGQILDALDRHRLSQNTLVVFMSDNGGEWLSNHGPLFHRKNTLWEGGIRVPAIFRWPAVLPQGKTSHQVGITMDVTATVLAAANVNVPVEARPEGRNLLPILKGDAPEVERTLFWRNTRSQFTQRAVRAGDWKLLLDGGEFLFNVREDVGERKELGWKYPERVRQMRALLDAWANDVDTEAKSRTPTSSQGS